VSGVAQARDDQRTMDEEERDDGQREYDICARFGGDEFVVVLPETPADEVITIRDRLLERIAEDARVLQDGAEIPVRASIGAATRIAADADVRDIIRRADLEMYAAKRGGAPTAPLSRDPG
jgi:diguanylate cyclase (GGDEF)-like protein